MRSLKVTSIVSTSKTLCSDPSSVLQGNLAANCNTAKKCYNEYNLIVPHQRTRRPLIRAGTLAKRIKWLKRGLKSHGIWWLLTALEKYGRPRPDDQPDLSNLLPSENIAANAKLPPRLPANSTEAIAAYSCAMLDDAMNDATRPCIACVTLVPAENRIKPIYCCQPLLQRISLKREHTKN